MLHRPTPLLSRCDERQPPLGASCIARVTDRHIGSTPCSAGRSQSKIDILEPTVGRQTESRLKRRHYPADLLSGGEAMVSKRFGMHRYLQALLRMRQGDRTRQTAAARLMGRSKPAKPSEQAHVHGWLAAEKAAPGRRDLGPGGAPRRYSRVGPDADLGCDDTRGAQARALLCP